MARYTGPQFKKARRYGFSILENNKEFAKGKQRQTPPGIHGAKKVKLSDYGLHLHEKQKVRYMYGINERQFARIVKLAAKTKGVTGEKLMQLLESRLDNLVYRSGLAMTRRQARQVVSHNHVLVNGHKANIPSMFLKPGDVISVKPKSQELQIIKEALTNKVIAPWLTRDQFSIKYDRLPERRELNQEIKEALIVEYYSR